MVFFDPFRFASIFGGTRKQVLPTKLPAAFKIVGNAITVYHAALGIAVALMSITQVSLRLQDLFDDVWWARLTTQNAVVVQQNDFVCLIPTHSFADSLSIAFCKLPTESQSRAPLSILPLPRNVTQSNCQAIPLCCKLSMHCSINLSIQNMSLFGSTMRLFGPPILLHTG